MIKVLSTVAIAAFDVHPVGRDCSQQAWPNFETSCLRIAGTKATNIREARLVTVDHMR
jgi:hypothetical protein